MPKQMHAGVIIALAADEFEAAAETLKIRPIWEKFLAELKGAALKFEAKRDTIETRAKVDRKPRKPRTPAVAPAPGAATDLLRDAAE